MIYIPDTMSDVKPKVKRTLNPALAERAKFIKENYDKVRSLPNKERFKKLSELYKEHKGTGGGIAPIPSGGDGTEPIPSGGDGIAPVPSGGEVPAPKNKKAARAKRTV